MIIRSTTYKTLYLRSSAIPIRAYSPSSTLDSSCSSNRLPLKQLESHHLTSSTSSSSASSTSGVIGDGRRKNLKEKQDQADTLSSAFINASISSTHTLNGPSSSSPSEESVAQAEAQNEAQAEAQAEKALHSTSSFLAAQAELEEEREVEEIGERLKAQKKLEAKVQGQLEAWDGEETRERMIRRILQDQYKPLRVKGHKKSITGEPTVVHPCVFATEDPSSNLIPTGTTSNQEDAPTSRPKKPWEYEYKAPASHGTSYTHPQSTRSSLLIRTGPSKTTPSQRLASAREKTMDYTFGVGVTSSEGGRTTVMVPSFDAEFGAASTEKGGDSLRAWEGFVEDKVNQAIRNGLFKDLKGRGKPLKVDEAESNPFLPIEDRLINRVVKGQGAMPPWIEMQQGQSVRTATDPRGTWSGLNWFYDLWIELQLNLSAFRNELRSAYTRRVTRMLSLPGNLSRSSVASVLDDSHRDVEWEERERSYHLASIGSLNALTRRFNIVAPYTARRGLLDLERELEACRRYCKPWIADELVKRIEGRSEMVLKGEEGGGKGLGWQEGGQVKDRGKVEDRFWPALRKGIWELLGIGGKPLQAQGAGGAVKQGEPQK